MYSCSNTGKNIGENMTFKTKQEDFWAGDFGNEYIERNTLNDMLPSRIALFSDILKHTNNI